MQVLSENVTATSAISERARYQNDGWMKESNVKRIIQHYEMTLQILQKIP